MITVQKAESRHVEGVCGVCTRGYWATYSDRPKAYIQRIVEQFYNPERVAREVQNGEYWVALDDDVVVGAGGGGMTGEGVGELFVLYVEPARKYEGIGTKLLEAVTGELRDRGAKVQWVSVAKGNAMAIPFYEARGFRLMGERKTYESMEDEDYVSLRYCREI